MGCKICHNEVVLDRKLYDDRYGYQDFFDIFKCNSCGHKFINAEFASTQLVELYTDYYPRSTFDVTNYKPAQGAHGFSAWLNGVARSAYCWVPENVRVLDIGCGFGETLGYHKARGCDVYGVEADENIRRVAGKFGFNVHVGLFDPSLYESGFFDYVTMDQVIEHVTDPVKTMKGVAAVLKTGGYAILSTPNSNGWGTKVFGKKWLNWHAPYHLQHFSVESMKIAAGMAGLTVEKYRTITSSEWLYYQWLHLLTYPRMGEPSAFWSHSKGVTKSRILFMTLVGLIHKTKINHIVTRFFDALGLGDNYLFFLKKI
jgi:2-polyprenyl-3-methyl-5-hydroxy-6-metoxy-1,4-benzoquinol methylase